jgi:hypothetical protein
MALLQLVPGSIDAILTKKRVADMEPLFETGNLVCDLETIQSAGDTLLLASFKRFCRGDWGDVKPEKKIANDGALKGKWDELLGIYPNATRSHYLYILTRGDREGLRTVMGWQPVSAPAEKIEAQPTPSASVVTLNQNQVRYIEREFEKIESRNVWLMAGAAILGGILIGSKPSVGLPLLAAGTIVYGLVKIPDLVAPSYDR